MPKRKNYLFICHQIALLGSINMEYDSLLH